MDDEGSASAEKQAPDWVPAGWQGVGDPSVPPYAAPPGWQPPQPYGAPPVGAPQYGARPYGAPYPSTGGGYPRPRDTNGFAIASLCCSVGGILVLLIGPALGVVFGVVALRQLGQSQLDRSPSGGRGLAIAGITIGIILFVLDVIGLIAVATDGGSSGPGGLSTLHALSAAVRLAIA